MSESKKEAIEEEVAEDSQAPVDQESEDVSHETEEDSDVDYRGELERLEKELAKKDKTLEKAEHKIVELKKTKTEPDDAIVDRIMEKMDEKLSQFQLQQKQSELESAISRVSSSPDEAKLIKLHLENSVKLTGDIDQDVRRAKLLANEKKITRTMSELTEVVKSKGSQSRPPMGGSHKEQKPKTPQYNEKERKLLQKFGVKLDET